LIASIYALASCGTEPIYVNSPSQTWDEACLALASFSEQTTYDDIVDRLGNPFDEYPTPSLPEEYVLFFPVPGEPKYMHWIMLHTDSRQFFYAGSAQQLKEEYRFEGYPSPIRQCDV